MESKENDLLVDEA